MKTKIFDEELALIKNGRIKAFAERAVDILPDYFFEMSASTTGKYHPSYTSGTGGLARHVKACMRIAYELFRIDFWGFTDTQKDLILVALLLHDGWKKGLEDTATSYSVIEHPLVASREIKRNFSGAGYISETNLDFICSGIETHMGQWVGRKNSDKEILQKPKNKFQKFIHLVDYLASRKCLEMNFEVALSTS